MSASPAPKVSVVVPVWNPGPGIRRCIDSLRGQSLADIEMLFVDDCGTDGAMDAVWAAAAEDPRIRILKNSGNLGSGPSRNRGIEAARGTYLSFVDPDDYAAPDFLERLHIAAVRRGLDIVKGTRRTVEDAPGRSGKGHLNTKIRLGLLLGWPLYALFTGEHQSALYRRAFILESRARYGRSNKSQDIVFLLRACAAAKSFGLKAAAEYYYVARQGSAVHRLNAATLDGELETTRELFDYLARHLAGDAAMAYAADRMKANLRLQACAESRPELKAAARRFLADLAGLARRLPFAGDLGARDRLVDALITGGANLSMEPYAPAGWDVRPEQWLQLAANWADWFRTRPDCGTKDEKCLARVFRDAREFYIERVMHGGATPELTAYLEALREQAARLPNGSRLPQRSFSPEAPVRYESRLSRAAFAVRRSVRQRARLIRRALEMMRMS